MLPDDDGHAAGQIERCLVGGVVAQVFTIVAGAGVDGRSVPDESPAASDGAGVVGTEDAVVADVLIVVYAEVAQNAVQHEVNSEQ